MTTKKIDTTLVSAGRSKRYTQGSVNSVIQRASSLVFDTVAEKNRPPQGAPKANFFMAVAAR